LIALIIGSFVLWLIVGFFWPDFFNPFQWWLLTDNIPGAVAQSWPFFLYGVIVTLIIYLSHYERVWDKEAVLVQDVYKSVMAGVLEELGFRCLFIFTSMAIIAVFNFITFGLVMWLWENLMFPLTDILTLGLMHNNIYGFSALLVAGALSANAKFRDGHKYQGIFGYINSWFAGLYLLSVMLTHGIAVAILVHMIYNLIITFIRYGRNNIG